MEKIGFIGLGIMGKPMSERLLEAGYPLTILSKSSSAKALSEAGANLVNSPKQVAENSDVVITCLPDSPEVEAVVLEDYGIFEGLSEGMLFIDMSTIAPATSINISNRLREKGVLCLDAPVSGGQGGAEAGTLSIMVGGDEIAFQRALPILEKMGKNIVRIGDTGAGQTTKACNQIIVGMTIQAVAEALTLAQKAGVDIKKVREALLGGFAQSKILDLHGQRVIERNFQPGFKVELHRKDMNIALQTGRELAVPLSGSALVAAQMDALIAKEKGGLDHSALALFLEDISGLNPE